MPEQKEAMGQRERADQPEAKKKPYVKPSLLCLGTVEELTHGKSSKTGK